MGYNISFKVKVEGVNCYVEVGDCDANTTWNVREMIVQSTGLPWYNGANNGLCKDVMANIERGYNELTFTPQKYKQYEAKNGWGTVESTRRFFEDILKAWRDFKKYEDQRLIDVVTLWIE